MWVGPIVWIVLLGLVVWLVVAVIRRGGSDGVQGPRRGKTPREILDERFARGEIDEEEYQRRRDVLGS
jgi:putative membrane protein